MKKTLFILSLLFAGFTGSALDLSDKLTNAETSKIEASANDYLVKNHNSKVKVVDCCWTIQMNLIVNGQPTGAFVGCRRCNPDCNLAQLDAVNCAQDLLEFIAE